MTLRTSVTRTLADEINGRAIIDIDMKTVAAYSAALGGLSTQFFIPVRALVYVTTNAGGALNGDCQITIGTAGGGTQILPITLLAGMNTINEPFSISLVGLLPIIAGNATLFCDVTTADTSAGGVTGRANVVIEGYLH